MPIPVTNIANLSKSKAYRLLAFNVGFVAFIYAVLPIVAAGDLDHDLHGDGYQSILLYVALIGGLYFWYSIVLIVWAMTGGRNRGVFIEQGRLIYLNKWTFSVPLSGIARIEVVSRANRGVTREYVQVALADGRTKTFPTQILDRDGASVIRAITAH